MDADEVGIRRHPAHAVVTDTAGSDIEHMCAVRGTQGCAGPRAEGGRVTRVVAECGVGIGTGQCAVDFVTCQDAAVAPPVAGSAALAAALVPQCDEAACGGLVPGGGGGGRG